jgi:protein O-GlcNAc transferase
MSAPTAVELALAERQLRAGQPGEAIATLEGYVDRNPTAAAVHARLGELRQAVGRLEPAIASYRTALSLATHPVVHAQLGIALSLVGRLSEAASAFEAALDLDPGFIDARVNLGMIRVHLGAREAGGRLIRQAAVLKPDHAESWQVAASAAYGQGDESTADTATQRVLWLSPGHGAALALRSLILRRQGRVGEAYLAARRAVVLDPRQAEMLAVAAVTLRDIGRSEEAVRGFRRALAVNPRHADARAALIMCLNFVTSATPAQLLAEAREWQRRHAPPQRGPSRPSIAAGGPLRVGLVSGDFKRHAVGYFLSGALPHLDSRRIEVQCFATSGTTDALTSTIQAAATKWHDISSISDDDVFTLVDREKIDVLLDMSGYTAGARLPLFALKPAPVQAAWIGYFGTTGLAAMDWLIADERLIPADQERWFSEKIMRLPDSYVCYAPPPDAPPVAPPPSDRSGIVSFGSCNTLAKITPATVAVWSRILAGLPGSRLLLKTSGFDADVARTSIKTAFAAHGVSADRIMLEGWSAYRDFLETYGRIDVALDPFPFCGGLTTVETLWMGVPLVSLAADRFAGRQSLSYLTTIGHPELCAQSEDEYVAIAIALGRDAAARGRLRARLRPDMASSPLLDGPRFARHLERAFEVMAGRRPAIN